MLELVSTNLGIALLVWTVLYASDYYLSLLASRLYRASVSEIIVYQGGLELTPQFRDDVASGRLLSPRWIRGLPLIAGLLSLVWLLSVRVLSEPRLFRFPMLGLILIEATVHTRHLRLLALYRRIHRGQGPTGRIEYPRWLLLDQSAVEFATFGLLYLLLFLMTAEEAILIAVLFCVSAAVRHWLWGRRELTQVEAG